MNVSAGIGVIGISSPMLQEVFGGQLIGNDAALRRSSTRRSSATIAGVAAGFTALLSLFNIGGRFFWASLSDKLGRKMTYMVFFVLGGLLYASIPASAGSGSKLLFVAAFCIILSMYGGGFATVPAYLADLFGTQMVGAIHGRLLTAWATAGIVGPVIINYMREYQLGLGIPREQVYNQTMFILVGLLVIGLICNLADQAARPQMVHERRRAGAREAAGAREGACVGRRRRGREVGPRKRHGRRRAGVGGGRHPARLGRLPDAAERRQVLQLRSALNRIDPRVMA